MGLPAHLGLEAHVKHAVGLVKHQVGGASHCARLGLQQVNHTSRRAHRDLRATQNGMVARYQAKFRVRYQAVPFLVDLTSMSLPKLRVQAAVQANPTHTSDPAFKALNWSCLFRPPNAAHMRKLYALPKRRASV